MKEKYKKITHKMAFLDMLSIKLKLKPETLKGYFVENATIPEKHLETINKAIDLQLKADERIKAIEVSVFDEL